MREYGQWRKQIQILAEIVPICLPILRQE